MVRTHLASILGDPDWTLEGIVKIFDVSFESVDAHIVIVYAEKIPLLVC
jgi:hypothetical protein